MVLYYKLAFVAVAPDKSVLKDKQALVIKLLENTKEFGTFNSCITEQLN